MPKKRIYKTKAKPKTTKKLFKEKEYKQQQNQSQNVVVNIHPKSLSNKRTYKKKETTKPQQIIPNNYNMPSFIINHQIPQIQQPIYNQLPHIQQPINQPNELIQQSGTFESNQLLQNVESKEPETNYLLDKVLKQRGQYIEEKDNETIPWKKKEPNVNKIENVEMQKKIDLNK